MTTFHSARRALLAAALLAVTFAAHAGEVTVAVAANFATPLNDLITAYQTAGWTYSASASFTVTSGATATLARNQPRLFHAYPSIISLPLRGPRRGSCAPRRS